MVRPISIVHSVTICWYSVWDVPFMTKLEVPKLNFRSTKRDAIFGSSDSDMEFAIKMGACRAKDMDLIGGVNKGALSHAALQTLFG